MIGAISEIEKDLAAAIERADVNYAAYERIKAKYSALIARIQDKGIVSQIAREILAAAEWDESRIADFEQCGNEEWQKAMRAAQVALRVMTEGKE